MCFYENLKKCRIEKGFSQKEIAELLGIAPSTYSLYESGKREPDVAKIRDIAKILKVSGDYLLFGTDHPFANIDEGIVFYNQLDDMDKAEIRGEMKHMLKAPKYSDGKTPFEDIAEELKQDIAKSRINTK